MKKNVMETSWFVLIETKSKSISGLGMWHGVEGNKYVHRFSWISSREEKTWVTKEVNTDTGFRELVSEDGNRYNLSVQSWTSVKMVMNFGLKWRKFYPVE
jgi:hypothetical protein